MSLVNVLVLLGAVTTIRSFEEGKIIGGKVADISKYPYVVSLNYKGSHICGASIIGTSYVLTSAHCLENIKSENLWIYAGSKYVSVPRQRLPTNWTKIHEKYDNKTMENDIAIIKLGGELAFGRRVLPIALPRQNEHVWANTSALILGWGSVQELGTGSYKLRKISIPVVDINECQKKYYPLYISSTMICAGLEKGGKDACQGDSGGPMVTDGKLVGIVSWGNGCARPGYPGIYTQVSKYRQWITTNTNI